MKRVLTEVGKGDYELGDLGDATRSYVKAEIDKMVRAHEGKAGPRPPSGLWYGIKAPVSMLLLPFFGDRWRRWKFVHVVRDGRDIAFSGNVSPVRKFYEFSDHKDGLASMEVKQIRLWSDWNSDVHEWCEREANRNQNFDFLVVKLEDFVDPRTRYAVVEKVADFVGSPLSPEERCCVSKKGQHDLGSHSHTGLSLSQRYGKWRGKVDGKPELKEELEMEGARGLDLFEYEPYSAFVGQTDCSC